MTTSPFRVVLDTNVWISGVFFRRGIPARLLAAWRDNNYQLIISHPILDELSAQLHQKTVKFGAPSSLADEWLKYVDAYAEFVPIKHNAAGVCRDPKDDQFLETAVSGQATHLVTGDKDLLVLGLYQDIPIITPRDFADLLEQD